MSQFDYKFSYSHFLSFNFSHNLFLHSALVLSRKVPNSVRGVNVSLGKKQILRVFRLFIF